MKSKKFLCKECKKPIEKKDELAVVGKSFHTYHNECFEAIKHKDIYAFYSGYKINGRFPWIMLILINFMLWGAYFFLNAPFDEVALFSLFIIGMTLLFRAISYFTYERFYE